MLPVAFLFERDDLSSTSNPFVKYTQKAVEPPAEGSGKEPPVEEDPVSDEKPDDSPGFGAVVDTVPDADPDRGEKP